MNTKTKLYESLEKFVDAVASGDKDVERDSMKSFIAAKAKITLEGVDSKIKLDGDDVMVSGKKIGVISHDLDDKDSPIQFESDDGEHKQEFASVDELYSFVSEKYNVNESAINEMDNCDCPKCKKKGCMKEGKCTECAFEVATEGMKDVAPAVTKQKTGASKRTKRMADSKKTKQADGKDGEYDGGSNVDMSTDAAHPGDGMVDGRHKTGYYDQHDPRAGHKDAIKGGSEAAHAGGEAELKTTGHYDKHDVRSKHKAGDHKKGGSATTKGKHDSK
jgi:hypothetical protein